jgi:hypothetical protein
MRVPVLARLLFLALLLTLLTGVLLSSTAQPAHIGTFEKASTNPVASASITQTSTSQKKVYNEQTWVRTSSSEVYGGSASSVTYTFDVSPYSTLYSATMSFLISVAQGEYARVVISQGALILLNTTSPGFTVDPIVGSTAVTETISTVMYQNGTIPGTGNYPVYTNATSTIQFALFSTAAWSYSSVGFNESLTTYANTSFGYYLNSTALSIPFPSGVSANYSTLTVKANNSVVAFQVSPTALFVLISNEAPNGWLTVRATFTPQASPAPPNPVVKMPAPTLSGSTYSEGVSWTDTTLLAYNGIYILELNGSSPLNTSSVTLKVNSVAYPSSSFVVSGSNLTILPGHLTVFEGQVVTFTVAFKHSPPGYNSVTDSLVLFGSGAYAVTLGDLLLVAVALLAIWIAAKAVSKGRPTVRDIASHYVALSFMAIFLAAYIAPLVI